MNPRSVCQPVRGATWYQSAASGGAKPRHQVSPGQRRQSRQRPGYGWERVRGLKVRPDFGSRGPGLQRSKDELHFLPTLLLSVIQSQCVGSFTTQTFQPKSIRQCCWFLHPKEKPWECGPFQTTFAIPLLQPLPEALSEVSDSGVSANVPSSPTSDPTSFGCIRGRRRHKRWTRTGPAVCRVPKRVWQIGRAHV